MFKLNLHFYEEGKGFLDVIRNSTQTFMKVNKKFFIARGFTEDLGGVNFAAVTEGFAVLKRKINSTDSVELSRKKLSIDKVNGFYSVPEMELRDVEDPLYQSGVKYELYVEFYSGGILTYKNTNQPVLVEYSKAIPTHVVTVLEAEKKDVIFDLFSSSEDLVNIKFFFEFISKTLDLREYRYACMVKTDSAAVDFQNEEYLTFSSYRQDFDVALESINGVVGVKEFYIHFNVLDNAGNEVYEVVKLLCSDSTESIITLTNSAPLFFDATDRRIELSFQKNASAQYARPALYFLGETVQGVISDTVFTMGNYEDEGLLVLDDLFSVFPLGPDNATPIGIFLESLDFKGLEVALLVCDAGGAVVDALVESRAKLIYDNSGPSVSLFSDTSKYFLDAGDEELTINGSFEEENFGYFGLGASIYRYDGDNKRFTMLLESDETLVKLSNGTSERLLSFAGETEGKKYYYAELTEVELGLGYTPRLVGGAEATGVNGLIDYADPGKKKLAFVIKKSSLTLSERNAAENSYICISGDLAPMLDNTMFSQFADMYVLIAQVDEEASGLVNFDIRIGSSAAFLDNKINQSNCSARLTDDKMLDLSFDSFSMYLDGSGEESEVYDNCTGFLSSSRKLFKIVDGKLSFKFFSFDSEAFRFLTIGTGGSQTYRLLSPTCFESMAEDIFTKPQLKIEDMVMEYSKCVLTKTSDNTYSFSVSFVPEYGGNSYSIVFSDKYGKSGSADFTVEKKQSDRTLRLNLSESTVVADASDTLRCKAGSAIVCLDVLDEWEDADMAAKSVKMDFGGSIKFSNVADGKVYFELDGVKDEAVDCTFTFDTSLKPSFECSIHKSDRILVSLTGDLYTPSASALLNYTVDDFADVFVSSDNKEYFYVYEADGTVKVEKTKEFTGVKMVNVRLDASDPNGLLPTETLNSSVHFYNSDVISDAQIIVDGFVNGFVRPVVSTNFDVSIEFLDNSLIEYVYIVDKNEYNYGNKKKYGTLSGSSFLVKNMVTPVVSESLDVNIKFVGLDFEVSKTIFADGIPVETEKNEYFLEISDAGDVDHVTYVVSSKKYTKKVDGEYLDFNYLKAVEFYMNGNRIDYLDQDVEFDTLSKSFSVGLPAYSGSLNTFSVKLVDAADRVYYLGPVYKRLNINGIKIGIRGLDDFNIKSLEELETFDFYVEDSPFEDYSLQLEVTDRNLNKSTYDITAGTSVNTFVKSEGVYTLVLLFKHRRTSVRSQDYYIEVKREPRNYIGFENPWVEQIEGVNTVVLSNSSVFYKGFDFSPRLSHYVDGSLKRVVSPEKGLNYTFKITKDFGLNSYVYSDRFIDSLEIFSFEKTSDSKMKPELVEFTVKNDNIYRINGDEFILEDRGHCYFKLKNTFGKSVGIIKDGLAYVLDYTDGDSFTVTGDTLPCTIKLYEDGKEYQGFSFSISVNEVCDAIDFRLPVVSTPDTETLSVRLDATSTLATYVSDGISAASLFKKNHPLLGVTSIQVALMHGEEVASVWNSLSRTTRNAVVSDAHTKYFAKYGMINYIEYYKLLATDAYNFLVQESML